MKKYVLLGLAIFAILMFISLPVSAAYGAGNGAHLNQATCPLYQDGTCINPDCPYDGIGPQDGTGMQYGRHSGGYCWFNLR